MFRRFPPFLFRTVIQSPLQLAQNALAVATGGTDQKYLTKLLFIASIADPQRFAQLCILRIDRRLFTLRKPHLLPLAFGTFADTRVLGQCLADLFRLPTQRRLPGHRQRGINTAEWPRYHHRRNPGRNIHAGP
ncbi:hypothetical protein D3C73_1102230 [compost metagenome]